MAKSDWKEKLMATLMRVKNGEIVVKELTEEEKIRLKFFYKNEVNSNSQNIGKGRWRGLVNKIIDSGDRTEILALHTAFEIYSTYANNAEELIKQRENEFFELTVENELFDEEQCKDMGITLEDINEFNQQLYSYSIYMFESTIREALQIIEPDVYRDLISQKVAE